MTLLSCGRSSTLLTAVTVPEASSCTSKSRCCTRTVVTLTAGAAADAPPAGEDALPKAAPASPCAVLAGPYHQTVAPTNATKATEATPAIKILFIGG